jgi:excisionase family DNA binding protein
MGHVFQKFVPPLSPRSARTRGQNRLNAGGVELAEDPFLTVLEVAQFLAVSTATVYKLIEPGALVHVRVLNTVRIPMQAVSGLVKRMPPPKKSDR